MDIERRLKQRRQQDRKLHALFIIGLILCFVLVGAMGYSLGTKEASERCLDGLRR